MMAPQYEDNLIIEDLPNEKQGEVYNMAGNGVLGYW